MMSQGIDDISHGGEMKEGVSVGEYMLKFCHWGQNTIERSTHLSEWIIETFGENTKF